MKCPCCGHVATHKITETRKFEGDVYRRRRCDECSSAFVTVETAPMLLEMPAEVYVTRTRAVYVKKRPPRPPVARAPVVHLENVWR